MKNKVLFVIITFVSAAAMFFLPGCNETFDSESQEKESAVESTLSDNTDTPCSEKTDTTAVTYILNRHTRKFHFPECYAVELMSERNKVYSTDNRDDILKQGYVPCKKCNP